jgi:hypothetical protein
MGYTLRAGSTISVAPGGQYDGQAPNTVSLQQSAAASAASAAASASAAATSAASLNLSAPNPIGSSTPNTGAFTTLSASSTVGGAGFTARFAAPGAIGSTTPSTGAFTTLNASGVITASAGVAGNVTGTAANVTGVVAIANGGTSGTSIATAQAALQVPSIVSNQNSDSKFLSSVIGTNTITGNLTPAITSYGPGQTFRFVAASTNTGATTININSVGAKAITKSGNTPLVGNEITIGAAIQIVYDGTQFQLTSGAGSSGNSFTQNNLNVPASTGLPLVGPITLTGVSTISGRLVIL